MALVHRISENLEKPKKNRVAFMVATITTLCTKTSFELRITAQNDGNIAGFYAYLSVEISNE